MAQSESHAWERRIPLLGLVLVEYNPILRRKFSIVRNTNTDEWFLEWGRVQISREPLKRKGYGDERGYRTTADAEED